MTIQNCAAYILVGALTGCASVNPHSAFQDLAKTVGMRAGKSVRWNRGTSEDLEAQRAVEALLRRPLTADSATQIALLNNHTLQATYEELGLAQADLVEAGLLKNPVFSVERRFPGQALELDVLKEFIDLLLLPLRKKIAAAEFEAAKFRIAHEVLNYAADVRAAFFQYQGAQQMLELHRTVAQATEQSAEAALQLHRAGNIKNLELANEQALHVQAKLDLAKAQSEATESREKLNRLMGTWGTQINWTATARLPDLPQKISVAGLESRAIDQRLDLAAARQTLLVQSRSLGLARFSTVTEATEIGVHTEREPEGNITAGPSLSLPIPIFNQGRPASARASAKIRQAQQRYLALAVDIRSDVRAAASRMRLAQERAEYYKSTALPLRQRIIDETQLEYNAMQTGLSPLLQAKQEEVKTAAEYLEALRDYWIARSDLEKTVGGSLAGGAVVRLDVSKDLPPRTNEHHH